MQAYRSIPRAALMNNLSYSASFASELFYDATECFNDIMMIQMAASKKGINRTSSKIKRRKE